MEFKTTNEAKAHCKEICKQGGTCLGLGISNPCKSCIENCMADQTVLEPDKPSDTAKTIERTAEQLGSLLSIGNQRQAYASIWRSKTDDQIEDELFNQSKRTVGKAEQFAIKVGAVLSPQAKVEVLNEIKAERKPVGGVKKTLSGAIGFVKEYSPFIIIALVFVVIIVFIRK